MIFLIYSFRRSKQHHEFDNPDKDVAYSLYSEAPYTTLIVEKTYAEVLRVTPKPPVVYPIKIISYFDTGATIEIKWLAGKAGEHYKHKQLRASDDNDSEIIPQELYRDLSLIKKSIRIL